MRQGQGLDTKPSLRGEERLLLGTRGVKVEFVELREVLGLFRLGRKARRKTIDMQRIEHTYIKPIY